MLEIIKYININQVAALLFEYFSYLLITRISNSPGKQATTRTITLHTEVCCLHEKPKFPHEGLNWSATVSFMFHKGRPEIGVWHCSFWLLQVNSQTFRQLCLPHMQSSKHVCVQPFTYIICMIILFFMSNFKTRKNEFSNDTGKRCRYYNKTIIWNAG